MTHEHVIFSKVNLMAVTAIYASSFIETINHTDKFFEGISHILSGAVSIVAICYTLYRAYLLRKNGKDVDGKG
jgi:hypothetical protein